MVLDFRVQTIRARRGIWQFNEPKIQIKVVTTFMGTMISNGMLTYILFAFLFTLVVVIITWQLTWDVILYVLRTQFALISSIVGFALINIVIKLVFTKLIVEK